MSAIKKYIKQFIKNLDFFSQNVTFRFNQQTQYQTLTGGFISLVLLCTFIGIFYTTFMSTLNRDNINFVVSTVILNDPSDLQIAVNQQFMFAISITGIDLNIGPRYFDITLANRKFQASGRTKNFIALQKCNIQNWQSLGFGDIYTNLNFDKWMCPSFDMQLNMRGKYTSKLFEFYEISISKCNISSNASRGCRSDSQIQNYLKVSQTFTLSYYFINKLINPGQTDYVTEYLQDINYYDFTLTLGVKSNIYISSYSIETDQSLWPLKDIVQVNGGVVLEASEKIYYQVLGGNDYLRLYLRKSPQDIYITRSFQRLDDTLSYVGGLFSSILVGMSFVALYNQFCYELEIAKNIFYFEKNDPLNSDGFNIFTFFFYLIYIGFSKLGIDICWPTFQRYHRFLEQIRKQMDMRLIMKKIIYSERLGLAILDGPKYKGLHMQEPITLDDAQIIRKDHRFYKNFRKKYFPNGQYAEDSQKQLIQRYNQNLYENSICIKMDEGSRQIEDFGSQTAMRDLNSQSNMAQNVIRHEDEFQQLDKLMQIYILQLKIQVDRGDRVAKRIFDKVDRRIKRRYLKSGFEKEDSVNIALQNWKINLNQKQYGFIKKDTIDLQ